MRTIVRTAVVTITAIVLILDGTEMSAAAQGAAVVVSHDAKGGVDSLSSISNSAKPASPAPPSPVSGPAGAWSFDEDKGSQIFDTSGNGNTGTFTEKTSRVSRAPRGKALSFHGSGGVVLIPNSGSLDVAGPSITISFWVWVDTSTASNLVILSKPWTAEDQTSPRYQYGVEYAAGSRSVDLRFETAGGVPRGPCSIDVSDGTWAHVTFTFDGSFVRGYRNGELFVTMAAPGLIEARGTPLTIGADADGSRGFRGQLDDLRIYSRALSGEEIASDFAKGVEAAADSTPPGNVIKLIRTDRRDAMGSGAGETSGKNETNPLESGRGDRR